MGFPVVAVAVRVEPQLETRCAWRCLQFCFCFSYYPKCGAVFFLSCFIVIFLDSFSSSSTQLIFRFCGCLCGPSTRRPRLSDRQKCRGKKHLIAFIFCCCWPGRALFKLYVLSVVIQATVAQQKKRVELGGTSARFARERGTSAACNRVENTNNNSLVRRKTEWDRYS